MDEAVKILIIILASTLSVLLVLLIIVAIKVVQIIGHIRQLTEKAEALADKAGNVASFFEHTAPQVALGRLISNVAETVLHHKKSGKKEE